MAENDIIKKYAKLLVQYSLGLKAGDKLLINSTYLAEELLKEVYAQALAAGAYPETGAKNQSAIHWDLLADMNDGQIFADGEIVYENGRFTIS